MQHVGCKWCSPPENGENAGSACEPTQRAAERTVHAIRAEQQFSAYKKDPIQRPAFKEFSEWHQTSNCPKRSGSEITLRWAKRFLRFGPLLGRKKLGSVLAEAWQHMGFSVAALTQLFWRATCLHACCTPVIVDFETRPGSFQNSGGPYVDTKY